MWVHEPEKYSCLRVRDRSGSDHVQMHEGGTSAGLVRIDVSYAPYLLLATFALLLVSQRLVGLDRLLVSARIRQSRSLGE